MRTRFRRIAVPLLAAAAALVASSLAVAGPAAATAPPTISIIKVAPTGSPVNGGTLSLRLHPVATAPATVTQVNLNVSGVTETLTADTGVPGDYDTSFTVHPGQAIVAFVTDSTGTWNYALYTATTGFGTSYGDTLSTTMATLPHTAWIRTYNASQRNTATSSFPSVPQVLSYKPASDAERTSLRVSTDPGHTAELATLTAYFSALADIPGQYASWDHERDKTTGASAANYDAEWAVFETAVIAPINATRTNPITTVSILTAAVFTRTGGMAPWDSGWADVLGWDVYVSARLSDAEAYAVSVGRAWMIPEHGVNAGGTPLATDAESKTRMLADETTEAGYGVHAPRLDLWFTNAAQDLTTYTAPNNTSVTYWDARNS